MKVTKSRSELFDVFKKIQAWKNANGVKFTYALLRIKERISKEIKKAQELGVPTKEFLEYDRNRIVILEKYCERDENGNPVIVNGEYKVTEQNKKLYEDELLPMKEENKKLVDERKAQQKAVDVFISEQVEIDFYDIKKDFIPETITLEQMEAIEPFICDISEEK